MGDAVVAMRREAAPDALVLPITGKIEEARFSGDVHYTVIKLPGVDEYSSAMPVELRSEQELGRVGDVVTVRARLTGIYKKQYVVEDTNPRTGQVTQRRVRPIVNTLVVIH